MSHGTACCFCALDEGVETSGKTFIYGKLLTGVTEHNYHSYLGNLLVESCRKQTEQASKLSHLLYISSFKRAFTPEQKSPNVIQLSNLGYSHDEITLCNIKRFTFYRQYNYCSVQKNLITYRPLAYLIEIKT